MKYSKLFLLLFIAAFALQSCQNDATDSSTASEKAASLENKEALSVSDKGDKSTAKAIAAVNDEEPVEAKLIEIFVEDPEEEAPTKKKRSKSSTKSTASKSSTKSSIPRSYDTPAIKTNTKPSTPKVTTAPAPAPRPVSGQATMSFDKTVYEFGRIKPGDVVKYNFNFRNTGSAPLVIENAEASCGCTHPSFPFLPIEPGDTGFIGVVFDSKGKIGKQKPKVTLHTNIGKKVIYLEGMVYGELAKPKVKTEVKETEENKSEEKENK